MAHLDAKVRADGIEVPLFHKGYEELRRIRDAAAYMRRRLGYLDGQGRLHRAGGSASGGQSRPLRAGAPHAARSGRPGRGHPQGRRGLTVVTLTGATPDMTWHLQGQVGGDPVRGPLNTDGLYGERHGWHLLGPGTRDPGTGDWGLGGGELAPLARRRQGVD